MKALAIALIIMAACVGGCRSGGSTTLSISADQYAQAFDIAKDEARKLGFDLLRIDARGGVIATHPVSTAGLATPWTRSEVTLSAEAQSFLHRDQRRVAFYFDPADSEGVDDTSIGEIDRRAYAFPMTLRVLATRQIIHRPGLRLSTTATRLSSVSSGSSEADETPIVRDTGEDKALSRLLAERIARRLNNPEQSQDG